jgi:two-component system, LytTR family, sensor kinase
VRTSLKRPGWLVTGSHRQVTAHALFWILQAGGWCAFAVVLVAVGGLSEDGESTALLTTEFVTGACVSLLCCLGLRWLWIRGTRGIGCAVAIVFAAIAGALTWWAADHLVQTLSGTAHATPGFGSLTRGGIDSLWFRAAVLGSWQLLYFAILFSVELELAGARARRAELEVHNARLRALQGQLQPHFLFNNLNAISTLVGDGRAAEARSALTLMAEFMRRTMSTRDDFEITVSEELETLRLYLDLVDLRFGDRVQSSICAEPAALGRLVPSLLLQPIVENAVRHGLLPRKSGGSVEITISSTDRATLITVVDDGVGLKNPHCRSGGLGLSNSATRLSDLYGSAATLGVTTRAPGGVRVDIQIPRRDGPRTADCLVVAEELP